ncbi:MAG: alpha/beta fold hydrolase [Pseudonocardiaceae bacterium]
MSHLRLVPESGPPSIAVDVRGRGDTPVVFIPGLGDSSAESFGPVMDDLKAIAMVVGYARSGIGESAPADDVTARGVRSAATELRQVLARAAVASPRVLVGHSYGALIALAYADSWPEDTAGVVLVDASDPQLFLDSGQAVVDDGDKLGSVPFDVVTTLEEIQSIVAPLPMPVTVVSSRPGRWLDLPPALARPWHPLTLLELDAHWQEHQDALAERLDADQVVAAVGGHYVQQDQPELVASVIRSMLPD